MADLHQVPTTAFQAVPPKPQPQPKAKLLVSQNGRMYVDLPTILSLVALVLAIVSLVWK